MKEGKEIRQDEETLLSRLEGGSCPHCTTGTLERDTDKENAAVVCSACEMP